MKENLNSIIDRMAEIEQEKAALSAEYDKLQAVLQLDAEQKLTDTKIKSVSHTSPDGNTAVVTIADTVSVSAGELLESIFGKVSESMFTKEIKYTLKAPAKRILSAVWHGEFCEGSVYEIISSLPCDDKAKKVLLKKVKGTDFEKDKKNLMNVAGLSETDASDAAYLINETAAWENLCTFIRINHDGQMNQEILADITTKINAAVNVSRSMKTKIISAESQGGAET